MARDPTPLVGRLDVHRIDEEAHRLEPAQDVAVDEARRHSRLDGRDADQVLVGQVGASALRRQLALLDHRHAGGEQGFVAGLEDADLHDPRLGRFGRPRQAAAALGL
jgi:hypothetical protein